MSQTPKVMRLACTSDLSRKCLVMLFSVYSMVTFLSFTKADIQPIINVLYCWVFFNEMSFLCNT